MKEIYEKGISSIQGYSDSGVIPVIKHFPGHSNTSPDSHHSLPIVNINTNQWNEYIQPFSNILEQTPVDALMIGHIKYPNIDNKPATISKEIITNKLINNLNYNGLVISDDMEMDALENIDSYTNIAKQAIIAGNDILIYSKYSKEHPTMQKDIYDHILNEVKNNRLNIDDKVLKILRMKIKYNIIKN
jgi:beta-N-acetylhexosaminidase